MIFGAWAIPPSAAASIALATLVLAARPVMSARSDDHQPGTRLEDESHQLTARERTTMEAQLTSAARRLGQAIFVVVANQSNGETPAQTAARLFAARSLDTDETANPVLLFVSPRDRAAAIETGKGVAGIVPEIDAVRITKRLTASRRDEELAAAVARAVDAIVASAEATAARRRPSSLADDPPPPVRVPTPPSVPEPTPAGVEGSDGETEGDAVGTQEGKLTGTGTAAPTPRRSRVPIAAGIAVLLLLALALRRRKSMAEAKERRPPPPRPPAPRPR
ncbi:MAG: TPM domain-containing protein [Pseudomonadota bacterium]